MIEYWVIDRFECTVTVFTQEGHQIFDETQTIRSALLPGFELQVAKLMTAIDRYQPSSNK